MAISRIGILELKSKLSEYLRRVMAGETIMVTKRGKAIAKIVPVQSTIEENLQVVGENDKAEPSGIKARLGKPVAINRGKKQLSDLVVEDRNVDYLPRKASRDEH